jgi:hypothetical protein
VCPECGRKARFDEVEITKSYGVFFIDLLDDKERKYRCSACHEVFDLRDGPDGATSARAEETRQAEREAERAAAAEARRAAEADRLRERARAQAVQAKAAQDRAAQAKAAQDRAAQAKAAQDRAAQERAAQAKAAQAKADRIEDELAELKKRMGR